MGKKALEFSGFILLGETEYFPSDIPLTVQNIREWAIRKGLIFDPDSQFLHTDRAQSLSKFITPEDEIKIALLMRFGEGEPLYLEVPFLPVKALIRRGETIRLVYWIMRPTRWDSNMNILEYGKVEFGFWIAGCDEEFSSVSNAKHVVSRFNEFSLALVDEYPFKELSDGARDVTVDGDFQASFFKKGRFYDVSLAKRN